MVMELSYTLQISNKAKFMVYFAENSDFYTCIFLYK